MWTPGDPHVREGVCIGLAELINATTKARIAELTARLTISTTFFDICMIVYAIFCVFGWISFAQGKIILDDVCI